MKFVFFVIALFFFSVVAIAKASTVAGNNKLLFVENNGQIKDQYGKTRNDIQFLLQGAGINIFIGNGQLHYQFSRTDVKNMDMPGAYIRPHLRKGADADRYEGPLEATINTYRLDVELLGANKYAKCVAGQKQVYYENYYLPGCPADGIRAYSYGKVTYKNIYPDIDWVIYINGSQLEHEFVVGSNGDASLIKLRYSGQTSIRINDEGSIIATTPMGFVIEKTPVCYSAGGVLQQSSYRLNGNILSYDLPGSKDAVLIDPQLVWGTYYGPTLSTSPFYAAKAFDSASIYACGLTWSGTAGTIATIGSFQNIFGGGTDAYLVKFDSGGNRIWATYYGGGEGDWATGIDCDQNGMVYMGGVTGSLAGMSTAGSQQPSFGGGVWDGFLVKFAPDGTRKWGTYAGGAGSNYPGSVSCNSLGSVYLAGDTNEPTNIATPSGQNPVKSGGYDWYLIKYDTLGTREWGTYYGGSGNEVNASAFADGALVYLTGWTPSTSGISTPLSFQPVFGGGNDVALIRFFGTGVLSWATYYGGTATEMSGGITCDRFHSVYLFGITESDNNISTAGSFHPSRAGSEDCFLAKFSPQSGTRLWGTYFGGPLQERSDYSRITTDDSANVYIIGTTTSPSGVASDTAWQTTYGGGPRDAFLAKFNRLGALKWSTYYGGNGEEDGRTCSFFGEAVYICGQTNSTDNVTTPDGFLPVGGGDPFYYQGYLAKFADVDTTTIPIDTTTPPTAVNPGMVDDLYSGIYPNPTNGTFHLHGTFGSRNGIAGYVITDISGKVLLTDKAAIHNGIISEQVILNAGTPAGIYYLKVLSPGIEQVIPFRKE